MEGWAPRPRAALAVRVSRALGSLVVGAAIALLANRALPIATTTIPAIGRALIVVAASTVAVIAMDRAMRRLLPLATLLQLSLIFPDNAPSRFRLALKSGSSRRLKRLAAHTRAHGLATDPSEAAEQVMLLVSSLGHHDRRTRGHSERVRLFAELIGEEMHLTDEERLKLQWGALLHDLGKIMVPTEILNKTGKPTAEEWEVLARHPLEGERLVQPLAPFLGEWVDAVGGHHERWDGTGYPRQLRSTEISRAAAIVAVADAFETMTAVRSYKRAMPVAQARAELTSCAGTHFSPDVVRAFLSVSLGRLRLAVGPLSALAHVPFLGHAAQVSIGTGASSGVGGALAGTLPALSAGALAASIALTPVPDLDGAAALPVGVSVGAGREDDVHDGVGSEPALRPAPTSVDDLTPTVTTSPAETPPPASTPPTTPTVTTSVPVTTTPPDSILPSTTLPLAPPTSAPSTTIPATSGGGLWMSLVSNRAVPTPLQGQLLPGGTSVYIFATGRSTVERIRFWLGPSTSGSQYSEDVVAPFDLNGTAADGTANRYVLPLTAGEHAVTVEIKYPSGPAESFTATFTVL